MRSLEGETPIAGARVLVRGGASEATTGEGRKVRKEKKNKMKKFRGTRKEKRVRAAKN